MVFVAPGLVSKAAPGDVPIHIIKTQDTDLNGATTPASSVTTTHTGIHPTTGTFDIVGAAPVGATYILCETVPPGFTFDLAVPGTTATDPAGLSRPCTTNTITTGDQANGRARRSLRLRWPPRISTSPFSTAPSRPLRR